MAVFYLDSCHSTFYYIPLCLRTQFETVPILNFLSQLTFQLIFFLCLIHWYYLGYLMFSTDLFLAEGQGFCLLYLNTGFNFLLNLLNFLFHSKCSNFKVNFASAGRILYVVCILWPWFVLPIYSVFHSAVIGAFEFFNQMYLLLFAFLLLKFAL